MAALAMPMLAHADCTTCSVRAADNSHLLETGLGVDKVLKYQGKPDSISNLVNGFGVTLGELWVYKSGGKYDKTLLIQLHNGRILRLKECHGIEAPTCTLDVNGGDD